MNHSQTSNHSSNDASKVLANTYKLLGLNLLTASALSYLAILMNMPIIHWGIVLVVHIALLFLVEKNAENSFGVLSTFLFTGWLGLTSGPIISHYLAMPEGAAIVSQALLGTATIFVSLSAWVNIKKTNVTGWGSFLSVGILSAFVLGILNALIFQSSIFSLLISIAFMLLSGAIIMWQTSAIIHGGERNYVRATTTLFVSIYNMFMSLLNILGNNR